MKTNPLKLAVQNKGRLSEKSLHLIRSCGIDVEADPRLLISAAANFPLELLFLRDDDIPDYVADGVADAGIVGRNEVDERGADVELVKDLKFCGCRLSLAVPEDRPFQSVADLDGTRIATSYPRILRNALAGYNISADIHVLAGSVEIAPAIGLTDAVFDIVGSGGTLRRNGLKEAAVLYRSSAVLIEHRHLDEEKSALLSRLLLRIEAVMRAADTKYILLNAPDRALDEIVRLIPGMKSPTVTPLAAPGWSSLQSVVPEDAFWHVIEQLKAMGAQGILVVPIEKMVY
ncbi:ATP phosphoribosyltransferase [bacterium]|nr:ATP phosphoribosyltransferase [bacterium]